MRDRYFSQTEALMVAERISKLNGWPAAFAQAFQCRLA
jgi:hypothetical protein